MVVLLFNLNIDISVGSEAKGSNSNFANFTGEGKNIITLLNSVEFS